jgi:hypothetical protein
MFVGRRLVTLLTEAGAVHCRSTSHFFGSSAGNRSFPAAVQNLIGVLEGARDRMLAGGVFGEGEFDTAIEALRGWSQTPGAALWYNANWAEGRRPRG